MAGHADNVVLAIFMIYLVMAILLRSFVMPMIILMVVPVSALWAHRAGIFESTYKPTPRYADHAGIYYSDRDSCEYCHSDGRTDVIALSRRVNAD